MSGVIGVSIKTDRELVLMRKAGNIVAVVLQELKSSLLPGVETMELERKALFLIKTLGGKPAFLGYRGYPYSICVSVNSEVVHGFPSSYILKEGDLVSIDVGVEYDGYMADAAITAGVGKITQVAERLIKVTNEALNRGLKEAKGDNELRNVSNKIHSWVEESGFSVVRDFVGHGIGKNLHESPSVPNFSIPFSTLKLKEGMTLTIEPMVTSGRGETYIDKNGWTAKTKDCSLAAHFEHTVLVTEQGGEVFTSL